MLKFIFMLMFLVGCGWGEVGLLLSLFFMLFVFMSPLQMEMSIFFFECDYISWNLVSLSIWVILLSIFSSMKIFYFNKLKMMYLNMMTFLLLFLGLSFLVSNLLMFYITFESCLVPILLMILGWGYQPERAQAGVYIFFYTLFGSLPLFFLIMYINNYLGSSYMYACDFKMEFSFMMFLFLVSAFLVKFPMYGVHLWLLKAHVEAPVAGSMILAGVLLKLGGYGLIRTSNFFMSEFSFNKEFIIMFSLWGGTVLSLCCLRFMDMKLLIAASSVVHMSSCIMGIFILTEWGMKGCLVMMVAHGLCSSGLFCLANIVYERTNSRSMMINKGLLNILPSLGLWWFILIVSNMAGPPSYNLVGEIMLLISVVSWSNFNMIMLVFLGFFSGAYSLYLYSMSQHGVFVKTKNSFNSGLLLEYLVLFLHWVPLNLVILSIGFMVCLVK